MIPSKTTFLRSSISVEFIINLKSLHKDLTQFLMALKINIRIGIG